jgi:hypothetical protein
MRCCPQDPTLAAPTPAARPSEAPTRGQEQQVPAARGGRGRGAARAPPPIDLVHPGEIGTRRTAEAARGAATGDRHRRPAGSARPASRSPPPPRTRRGRDLVRPARGGGRTANRWTRPRRWAEALGAPDRGPGTPERPGCCGGCATAGHCSCWTNCEHLAAAARGTRRSLLARCPHLRVLATSRVTVRPARRSPSSRWRPWPSRPPTPRPWSSPDPARWRLVVGAGPRRRPHLRSQRGHLVRRSRADLSAASTGSRWPVELGPRPVVVEHSCLITDIAARLDDRVSGLLTSGRARRPRGQSHPCARPSTGATTCSPTEEDGRPVSAAGGFCSAVLEPGRRRTGSADNPTARPTTVLAVAVAAGGGGDGFDVFELHARLVDRSLIVCPGPAARIGGLRDAGDPARVRRRPLSTKRPNASGSRPRTAAYFTGLAGWAEARLRGAGQDAALALLRRLSGTTCAPRCGPGRRAHPRLGPRVCGWPLRSAGSGTSPAPGRRSRNFEAMLALPRASATHAAEPRARALQALSVAAARAPASCTRPALRVRGPREPARVRDIG